MNVKGLLISIFLMITACPFLSADQLYLKNGESFEVTIMERTDQYIKVMTGGAPVYIPIEQVDRIVEGDAQPMVVDELPQPQYQPQPELILEEVSPSPPQEPENKLINGKDGQYYYQKARTDLQTGRLKESMDNLYLAVSLGVEDSDGLKEQINQAVKLVQTISDKKAEIVKATDEFDPGTLKIVLRIGFIVVAMLVIGFLVKFLTREPTESAVSPLLQSKSNLRWQGVDDQNFVKAGSNKRLCAFFIDTFLIFMVPNALVLYFGGQLYSSILWPVYLLLKDCFNGQSLGKWIVGIKIVDMNNHTAAPNQTVMRNLFWILVCVLPLFYKYLILISFFIILSEYVGILRDPLGQRLGDRMSLTRVADLKPLSADWKYIFFSLIVVVVGSVMFSILIGVLNKVLNRPGLL